MKLPLPLALSALAALAPLAWATPAGTAHPKGLQGPPAPGPGPGPEPEPEPMPDPAMKGPYRQSPPRPTGLSELQPQVQLCAIGFSCWSDADCAKQPSCRVLANYDPTLIFCGYALHFTECNVQGKPDPHPITRRFVGGKTASKLPASTSPAAAASAPNLAPTAAFQI
ncbi:hypothetical protein ACJ73_08646 [Blastomyces percursus]|uniref:Extracellular membrane protein CFEM domain-containing protein n=1 Tax=Blastomyces percursus TaxID=1658174 RepID=A0A1J9QT34_9EURO|nr:hypothetical protein ACJ73_08646 [Blastomyces percursus]